MKPVTVYSSAPLSTKLSCAFQNLSRQGVPVIVRPLSELPLAPSRQQREALRDERLSLQLSLANIGTLLDAFESGTQQPALGQEPGLRAERESLRARLRGVEATLRGQGGTPLSAS